MSKKVLAICAHPDDETLGCGGTLLKHRQQGDELHWIIATSPHNPLFDDAFRERRKGQIADAADAYGFASVRELGFPAAGLEHCPMGEVIRSMSAAVRSIGADVVYLVHRGDVHGDHRITFDAAWTALKPMIRGSAHEILAYETLSSTNLAAPFAHHPFVPTAFSDIGAQLEEKLRILALYEGEIHPSPHPRSAEAVRALAITRGASIGVAAAEAFSVLRSVF